MCKLFPLNNRLLAGVFVMMAIWFACSPSTEYPKKETMDEIHFGQGGGFSGVIVHYILLEDGRLFQQGWKDSVKTYVDTWPGLFTRQMFLNYRSLKIDELNYNEPGDLYYFVEYHAKKKQPHRITWGRSGVTVNPNLTKYYNLLYRSVNPKP